MKSLDKNKTKELDKIILNNESYDKLIDLIKNPPEPSPKLVKLFKEFNKTKELDYKKMVKDIYKLVGTDFAMDMDMKCLPHSKPYTQEEAGKMAGIIGQIFSISHCYYCTACQGKYKL